MTDATPEEIAQVAEEIKAEDAEVQAVVEAGITEAEKVEKPQAQAGPMKEVPPGQRELVALLANKLMDEDEELKKTVGTMIAARHLYVVARRDLTDRFENVAEKAQRDKVQEILEGMPEKPEEEYDPLETYALVEEYLIQAAAHGGSLPFNENDLFAGLHQTVFPWLVKAVERHNAQDAVERKKQWEEMEKLRRGRPVPLGCHVDPMLDDKLPRDHKLVVAGWRPAVLFVLDKLVSNVLAIKDADQLYCALRLMLQAPQKESQPRLFRLGGKLWEDCCKSNKSWYQIFTKHVVEQLSQPVDLLVCDDLAHAGKSSGLFHGNPARKAGYAQKKFGTWCEDAGAALLAAVPLDSKEPPTLNGPDWEELRLYTTLRPVWVQEEGDTYRVYIGKDTLLDTVPKELLDSRDQTKIIVPN